MKKIVAFFSFVLCGTLITAANEPEILTQEFIAPPVKGHVHASTLLPLADGGYLAAWFEGTREGAGDVAIKGCRRKDGRWGHVRMFAKVNDDAPHWNPVLWRADDGRIVLFFKVGRNCSDWRTYVRESRDEGENWTPPCELIAGEVRGGRGPVRNKCLRLASGRWLAPASREIKRWRAFVDISDDDGRTWRASPEFPVPADAPEKFGVIQPTLWNDASGVHALLRAKDGWIWQTDSADGGETWRELYRSPLENINSGIDCVRASDGKLYLVLNGADPGGKKGTWGARSHLEIRSSSDGGKTWQTYHVLADDAPRQPDGRGTEFSYPAILESRPGVLAMTFTWNRRQIRFVELRLPQAHVR